MDFFYLFATSTNPEKDISNKHWEALYLTNAIDFYTDLILNTYIHQTTICGCGLLFGEPLLVTIFLLGRLRRLSSCTGVRTCGDSRNDGRSNGTCLLCSVVVVTAVVLTTCIPIVRFLTAIVVALLTAVAGLLGAVISVIVALLSTIVSLLTAVVAVIVAIVGLRTAVVGPVSFLLTVVVGIAISSSNRYPLNN